MNLVDDAINQANGDTIGMQPDAYLRQCCGNVWTLIRDRLTAAGQKEAAALVQDWCEPDWVRQATGKAPRPKVCKTCGHSNGHSDLCGWPDYDG